MFRRKDDRRAESAELGEGCRGNPKHPSKAGPGVGLLRQRCSFTWPHCVPGQVRSRDW